MNPKIKELAEQAGFDAHWFEEHPTGCSLPKPLMLKELTEFIILDIAEFVGQQRNDIPACGFEFEAAIKHHYLGEKK